MNLATPEENKAIYTSLHDEIIAKRFQSPHAIRRYAHNAQYQAFVDAVPADATVLDAGCGEGVLSVLLAKKGCTVHGVDISEPNIEAAKRFAETEGVADRVTFEVGDAEHLPVPDNSYDYVVSSHVLEHVPEFEQGARELSRVARERVIIAIPTCLNLCAMVLLGNDKYWTISRASLFALPIGILRVLWACITFDIGVNEGYEGRMELIHIWRFPHKGKKQIERGNLKVLSFRGSSYPFPYLPFLVPLSRFIQLFCCWPLIRGLGYGTTYVCEPRV